MAYDIDLLDTERHAPKPKGRVRRALERGNTTAEYAVGILAAVALSLVLLKIFTGNDFFSALLKLVLKIIAAIADKI